MGLFPLPHHGGNHVGCRKRGRVRHRGRSIDPTCPSSSQSSSDLSSPNESCYSFVRRALQKLAGTKRNRGGRRPWFLQGLDIPQQEGNDPLVSMEDDVGGLDFGNMNNAVDHFMPIELRQLESTEFAELLQLQEDNKKNKPRGMIFSNVLYPRRRRTLETTGDMQSSASPLGSQPKSKSLSDLFGLLPVGILRSAKKSTDDVRKGKSNAVKPKQVVRSHSSLSGLFSPNDEIEFPDCVRHKAVQTESLESIDLNSSSVIDSVSTSNTLTPFQTDSCSTPQEPERTPKKLRPTLVKQKHSICSSTTPHNTSLDVSSDNENESPEVTRSLIDENGGTEDPSIPWREIKESVKDLPEFKQPTGNTRGQNSSVRAALAGSSFWKQTSLNEELIFSERLKEKERLKQNIQKQCSLNEELIYKQRENTRWDQMKEAFLNSSNVKCLQLLKHGISSRFRGSDPNGNTVVNNTPGSISSVPRQPYQTSSIRNGLVRMLQNWKQGDETPASGTSENGASPVNARRGSKEGTTRRGLFPPFFLRRSSAGSLNVSKIGKDLNDPSGSSQILSPPPYLKRRPSDNELLHDGMGINGNSNKLIPGVRHVRKLSREEGSDSSKDSSFQSDTSVDSEDSFASVIFIPKTTSMDNAIGGGDPLCFNSETRANSTDSDRSPKSPASRLSPPSHNVPKSPSPLASEILRKRSPEVSPTRMNVYGNSSLLESFKFVFDESATVATANNSGSSIECTKSLKEELGATALASVTEEESQSPVEEKIVVKKAKCEKIEVLRKPAVFPEQRCHITRQLVRRSLPKALAVELFNPETDDADTSDTSSSSPNSVSSVVSVVNDDGWNASNTQSDAPNFEEEGQGAQSETVEDSSDKVEVKEVPPEIKQVLPSAECKGTADEGTTTVDETPPPPPPPSKPELPPEPPVKVDERRKLSSAGLLEAAVHVVTSLENLVTQSSPKARRKFTLARLGSTSEWLSSLPTDLTNQNSSKRQPAERRTAGEKILMGEVKKMQPKGPDAKWPASIIDESPPQTAKLAEEGATGSNQTTTDSNETHAANEIVAKLGEELDEKDSLYDSMENLTNNPSVDSSVRMSSTCSCSIRGGDSFDSWTSAKSSLTNSSSTHHKTSFPSLIPLQAHSSKPSSLSNMGGSGRIRGPGSCKSSAAGEDTEDSTALTYHRYYHVFREGELDKLIEKYVQNLHIISSYYDHANWCIIAEKVQVWTI
ncbi:unnamed protein product [Allacma fusca]|uniref:Uncharacterized protein n=1 Tax=Allacma fusca TaxID=39272 RepID=A0A8J2K421_9HEXA|nr:unnamed protein product [Allacma fusca]